LAGFVALAGLPGCGNSDPYAFAPPCPSAAILADAGDVTVFRPGGQDLTAKIAGGRMTAVRGTCSAGENGRTKVVVQVRMDLTRGPAARSREIALPYFVAVMRGDEILAKAVQTAEGKFGDGQSQLSVTGDDVTLNLPTTKDQSAAAFSVRAGFQLTPDQLAFNRSHKPGQR
jgi:hypothetical protein